MKGWGQTVGPKAQPFTQADPGPTRCAGAPPLLGELTPFRDSQPSFHLPHFAFALVALLLLAGCSASPAAPEMAAPQERLVVFAGIPPLAYLVERIGGPHVEVHVLVQPGQDPHVFQPAPRQLMAVRRATLLFKIGMPFEEQLVEKIAGHHGRLVVVDATAGIPRRHMSEECGHHGHEAETEHADECGAEDPHLWLSVPLLRKMAAKIAKTLQDEDKAHGDEYGKNLARLDDELEKLDGRIRTAMSPYRGQAFYVFHPAFGYFADDYGLTQQAVEMEGRSPSLRQLRALIHQARAEGVKVLFLQPQFDPRAAEAVARAIGGSVVPLDPLARDVIGNLDDAAAKIKAALQDRQSESQTPPTAGE